MQANEPSPTSMCQMVLEIFCLKAKSGFWARWTLPFCRFSTSFSLKYDVTDAMLQDKKKLYCNVSEVFSLICLKLCRLLEPSKEFSLDFKFRYYGNTNQNY